MGRANESLNQLGADEQLRGSAAGAVGREVVEDFADAFEKHLGGALGNETAKNLGREYGESLVKNWAGKADWQGLTRSLDDALKPFAKDSGEAGVRRSPTICPARSSGPSAGTWVSTSATSSARWPGTRPTPWSPRACTT
ncbi:hypothetical protein SCALM49S_09072 [Streptomyces californicus]